MVIDAQRTSKNDGDMRSQQQQQQTTQSCNWITNIILRSFDVKLVVVYPFGDYVSTIYNYG
jgi:hypothetical protein